MFIGSFGNTDQPALIVYDMICMVAGRVLELTCGSVFFVSFSVLLEWQRSKSVLSDVLSKGQLYIDQALKPDNQVDSCNYNQTYHCNLYNNSRQKQVLLNLQQIHKSFH